MLTYVCATVPYAWPFDGGLKPCSSVLIVCGAQRRLVAACPDGSAVVARLIELADEMRELGGRVVWVRHGRRPGTRRPGDFLPVRGETGWEFVEPPDPDDAVVDAAGWDGCYASDLEHTLALGGTRFVLLGGAASELTVDSTVRTLNDRGHECLVLTDGCAPLDTELGARVHHSLTMSGGIFGALGTIGELGRALDRTRVDLTTRSSS